MNKPKFLFKYFTEDRIDLLQNGFIRFTQPKEFNDPFETFPYFKSIGPHDAIDEHAKTFDSNPNYYEQILEEILLKDKRFKSLSPQNQALMGSLSTERLKKNQHEMSSQIKSLFSSAMKLEGDPKPIMIETILKSINMSFGILCFTEKKDNLLMWSHYANSHKGFVLEFFPDHIFFDRRKKGTQIAEHLKKVRYTIKRPEFIFFNDDLSKTQMSDNWIENFIWVKSAHWEYEQEWRILTTLNMSEKTIEKSGASIHLFPFPHDAIKNIYLGCKMRKKNKSKILSLLKNKESLKHTNAFYASQDEKEYRLQFTKIDK
ncbi:DUF2971 domain-containing protein [Deltaproteobacteria bacterium]|nr:DUF2971 domain-containing protein [Deltaproteobacteria bacterium]